MKSVVSEFPLFSSHLCSFRLVLPSSSLRPSVMCQISGGHPASPVEPRAAGREEQQRGAEQHRLRRTHVQEPVHARPAEQRQPQ